MGYSPWDGKESDTTEQLTLSLFTFVHWRRKWQPTPVFLPGEFHGQRSLVDYSPQGPRESDMTEHSLTQTPTDPPWPDRGGHPSTDSCVAPVNAAGRQAYYHWV